MADSEKEAEIRRCAERLFYPVSLKGKVPKKDAASRKLGATTVKALSSNARVSAQIIRTARRSPEVMVKITNRLGAGKGMAAIRNHLTYISRNGKLDLETDTGERLSDKSAVADYSEEMKDQIRGKAIPEISHRREAFNIILSMQAGTPPDKVREATREFLQEEFGDRHRYCFTLHSDTDKPHVHACVLAAPLRKGKRLNPRKADLQRWREGFAEQLRHLGVDANATPRRTRGSTKPSIKQSGHHVQKRQKLQLTQMTNPVGWPTRYQGALHVWQRLIRSLKSSTREADQLMAQEIDQFVAGNNPRIPRKR